MPFGRKPPDISNAANQELTPAMRLLELQHKHRAMDAKITELQLNPYQNQILLQRLKHNQSLVFGVPTKGLTSANIVTKKKFDELPETSGVITRSNGHFEWPSGAGIMMFDYDPDGEPLDQGDVLALLYEVCPAIKDVDHLWWVSSSSNIFDAESEEELAGVSGQRLYLMIEDAKDIPRAAKVLGERLWIAGHGYFKVSASGGLLERIPFDMCIYQPSRLDFAAGAYCEAPLTQQRGEPVIFRRGARLLDTVVALPDLTLHEKEKLTDLKIGAKAIADTKTKTVRDAYIVKMTELFAPEENESAVVTNGIQTAIDRGDLPPYWLIDVWDGSRFIQVSVEDILSEKHKYHEMLCLDPLEPDYDQRRIIGKIYTLQEKPLIHSFARGGRNFRLLSTHYLIALHANLHNAVNESIMILRDRQEVFTFGGTLVSPVNGKLVCIDRPKMKHLLGSLITFRGKRDACDPSNDLVDGVSKIGAEKNVNPVTGFVDHPIVDPQLRMLDEPGYDRTMKVLAVFNKNAFNVDDRELTQQEVLAHFNEIYAPFTGFELGGAEDVTVLMAAVFSAVFRAMLPTCPAFGFDAPVQGSGKTLLAETISILASGSVPSTLAPGRSDYDEEFRKRLFALLLKGEKVCLFDNIVGEFDSPSFAASLTSEYYEDRILQHSKTSKVLVKTLFLITGNNLRFKGDMCRRVIKCRLTPKNAKLSERKFAFDPMALATEKRNEIISSVLSLVNHWKHCGMPKETGAMTSFTEWDTLVRQPLAYLGKTCSETGLLDVLEISNSQQSDASEKEDLLALLKALARRYGGRFKASQVFKAIGNDQLLQDSLYAFESPERLRSSSHVGKLLKQFVDRHVDGFVLRGKLQSGSMVYWMEVKDQTFIQEVISALGSADDVYLVPNVEKEEVTH
jgi:hypothetical protein